MTYLPRNKSRNLFAKFMLFLVTIFVAGIIIVSFFAGPIISVVSPLWRSETWVGNKTSELIEFFKTKNSLISENDRLKMRIAALEIELAANPSVGGTEEFAELLGRRREEGGVASAVLARPPQSIYDILVIDAGSRDGLDIGHRVFMAEGPFIGIVSDVFSSSAKVRLLSTSGEKTSAVLERHGIPVTIEGAGGGNFHITVPRETEVMVGDRILSADISGRLVAVVGEVVMKPTDSFKEILAISPINIFNIHFVLVRP